MTVVSANILQPLIDVANAVLVFFHDNMGLGWGASIIALTFLTRALLIPLTYKQLKGMRALQALQPQMKELQEKYKNDRTKLAEEMQKLQKEHGVNPLGGCLPLLVQLPVFIGLFHVLRGFQPSYPYNYVFDRADIESFLAADLFGVRLSEAIAGGMQSLGTFAFNFGDFQAHVLPVALPLMIAAAVATHFTARVSQQHQSPAAAANPQAAIMAKITMWLFPAGLLVFGAFFPVAILIYFLSQNTWTLGQQFLIYRKIAREEEEKREQAREQRDALAPRPGQKPQRQRAGSAATTVPATTDGADTDADADVATPEETAPAGDQRAAGAGTNGADGGGRGGGKAGSGRRAPGKVGPARSGSARQGSGSAAPGKVARSGGANGKGANGKGGNGKGANGKGSGGTGGNGSGGKGGQLASSGQGKRPKKKK